MILQDIYNQYPTKQDCLTMLEFARWGNSPICPKCGSAKYSPIKERNAYHCNFCNRTFTVTNNTLLHKSKVDLQKWFYAIIDMLNPNSITTARDMAIAISVTKDTAWSMQRKIKSDMISSPYLINSIERIITEHRDGNKQNK